MEVHARPLFEAEVFQLVPVSINEEQKPSSLERVTRGKEEEKVSCDRDEPRELERFMHAHTVDRRIWLSCNMSAKTNDTLTKSLFTQM